jgi:MFS family permease
MKNHHPLIDTLLNLKGNPKACVLTEPLWGIPNSLVAPYASIYMYALGVKDAQIGFIASVSLILQIVFSLLSGAITDKLGRKRTTFIFDIIAWSIPCLIWAFSRNFTHFLVAAIINSIYRITANSWGCLLVEDSDKEKIVNIYAWIYISGLVAAFFAPISGLFIARYELIPTVRVLYFIAFIMMTAKFVILNIFADETHQGKVRIEETRGVSITSLLGGYGKVLVQILKTPETMVTLGIMLIMNICTMVNNTFWSLAVTQRIHISEKSVGMFPFLRSFIMLIFFFTIVPRLGVARFKRPLIMGFSTFIISQLILISAPEKGYLFLIISIILEACSLSLINPLLDSMQVIMVDPKERARIISILYVIVIAFTSPFGWIAGVLSGIDKRLPFIMNIILLITGALLTCFASVIRSKMPVKTSTNI